MSSKIVSLFVACLSVLISIQRGFEEIGSHQEKKHMAGSLVLDPLLRLSATRSSCIVPCPPLLLRCPSPRLPCTVHHPPSSCYLTPACHPSYLSQFDCCGNHPCRVLDLSIFLRIWQIVNVVDRTMTITSMWMHKSSPPPTNLFINMLVMVPANSLQSFTCIDEMTCDS